MVVPILRTWLPGDLTTFEMLNAQIRDVSNYEKSNYPRLHLTRYSSQSITNDVADWTDMEWDKSIRNSEGSAMHNALSNNHLVTILTTGLYDLRTQILWQANSTGRRAVRIYDNTAGTHIIHSGVLAASAPPDGETWTGNVVDTNHEVSIMTQLAAGTVLKVQVWQNSGGAVNAYNDYTNSHIFCWFALRWIAPS